MNYIIDFIISAILLGSALMIILFDKLSIGWPFTEGKLIKALVIKSGNINCYSPYVLYEYNVSGRKYYSEKRVFVDGMNRCQDKANDKIKDLKINSSVTVYYFPLMPSISVLVRDGSSNAVLIFLFIMSVVFLGVGFISYSW